jgi:hypothetical protein
MVVLLLDAGTLTIVILKEQFFLIVKCCAVRLIADNRHGLGVRFI